MFKDPRHGVRMLLRAKAWTAVVVISLALGIGANTALFSAVNGLLLKKLSVTDPDSLVRLRWAGKNDMVTSSSDYGFSGKDDAGRDMRATFSYDKRHTVSVGFFVCHSVPRSNASATRSMVASS